MCLESAGEKQKSNVCLSETKVLLVYKNGGYDLDESMNGTRMKRVDCFGNLDCRHT